MNVQDLTFGVEIETVMPIGSVVRGGHGSGIQVQWLPAGWLADNDPSIHAHLPGTFGVEFVSPVLKGSDGIAQLIAAINTIKEHGGDVNQSGGLHVHVGFDKRDEVATEKLVSLVGNFEDAIYAQTGRKDRENGRWCRSLARNGNVSQAIAQTHNSRYNVLNLQTGGKPTVEFRAFGATLDPLKVVGHVLTCLGLCEKALTKQRKTPFKAKTPKESSPIHRGGKGQTAVCRLFYFLGWTKGREDRVWGNLFPEQIGIKSVKKTLMLAAKTFDSWRMGEIPRPQQATPESIIPDLIISGYDFHARWAYRSRRAALRRSPPPFVVLSSRRPTTTATQQPAPAGLQPGDVLLSMLRAVQPNQNETPS